MKMNRIIYFVGIIVLISSCLNHHDEHNHSHDTHNDSQPGNDNSTHEDENHAENVNVLEALSYTLYSENYELFVEFEPLIVGVETRFAAHFTKLGESFTSVNSGTVNLTLERKGQVELSHISESTSSPGIFRLKMTPHKSGVFDLVFRISSDSGIENIERIAIEDINVFEDFQKCEESLNERSVNNADEITYLKEQAWKIDFATEKIVKRTFYEVIQVAGEIASAQGNEVIVTAKSGGIIHLSNHNLQIGAEIYKGETLMSIGGVGLTENNLVLQHEIAKVKYEKEKVDFQREKSLYENDVISLSEFQTHKLNFNTAMLAFMSLSDNYANGSAEVISETEGFITELFVKEGEYVDIGTPLAIVTKNSKLFLKAEVPQKHFGKLNSITSANFRTVYSELLYDTQALNGEMISYGKSAAGGTYYLPVTFEIDNREGLIPGSFVDIYLKTSVNSESILIPNSSILEEQGNFFSYVQTSGESFQKRYLTLGNTDGEFTEIKEGIDVGDRVVIKGAYSIKLAIMSGVMPAHGHEH